MSKIVLYKGAQFSSWFKKLSTKEKNKFLDFTYWCTTETKVHQRHRGFISFCMRYDIKSIKHLEYKIAEKGLFDEKRD